MNTACFRFSSLCSYQLPIVHHVLDEMHLLKGKMHIYIFMNKCFHHTYRAEHFFSMHVIEWQISAEGAVTVSRLPWHGGQDWCNTQENRKKGFPSSHDIVFNEFSYLTTFSPSLYVCLSLSLSLSLSLFLASSLPQDSPLILQSDRNVTVNARNDLGQLTGQLTVGE